MMNQVVYAIYVVSLFSHVIVRLHDLVTECRATGVEVFMAIYSSENIM